MNDRYIKSLEDDNEKLKTKLAFYEDIFSGYDNLTSIGEIDDYIMIKNELKVFMESLRTSKQRKESETIRLFDASLSKEEKILYFFYLTKWLRNFKMNDIVDFYSQAFAVNEICLGNIENHIAKGITRKTANLFGTVDVFSTLVEEDIHNSMSLARSNAKINFNEIVHDQVDAFIITGDDKHQDFSDNYTRIRNNLPPPNSPNVIHINSSEGSEMFVLLKPKITKPIRIGLIDPIVVTSSFMNIYDDKSYGVKYSYNSVLNQFMKKVI